MAPIRRGDGTGIGSIRLGDGTEVSEVRTVDGQTVFTAFDPPTIEPVAYSNMVAWWPFEPAKYGGSPGSDVTALFNPGNTADSTAYDLPLNGNQHIISGGGTDINAGPNSGHLDVSTADMQQQTIPFPSNNVNYAWSCWFKGSANMPNTNIFDFRDNSFTVFFKTSNGSLTWKFGDNGFSVTSDSGTWTSGNWFHVVMQANGGGEGYLNGNLTVSRSTSSRSIDGTNLRIFSAPYLMDDFRLYDRPLTQSEITQIYNNTPHP